MTVRIEEWSICSDSSVYMAPELRTKYLHGKVYGHPNYADGHQVNTSAIVRVVDGIVETESGSKYELGNIDPDYEKAYPGARDRALANEYRPNPLRVYN